MRIVVDQPLRSAVSREHPVRARAGMEHSQHLREPFGDSAGLALSIPVETCGQIGRAAGQ
jgi:hypothetical protein